MTSLNNLVLLTIALTAIAATPGCSNSREALGLTRKAPDEFAVVKRAPLEIPPNYDLSPPQPGKQRPQELHSSVQAKQAIFGKTQLTKKSLSAGENDLLEKAGAQNTDPTIRQIIDKESIEYVDENKPVLDKLLGRESEAELGEIIDPVQESERLKQSAQ